MRMLSRIGRGIETPGLPMALGTGLEEPPRRNGPNLVLDTIDILRADVPACHCREADVARASCGLAKQGIRYDLAFAPPVGADLVDWASVGPLRELGYLR